MATSYFPILIMLIVAVGFAGVSLILTWLLAPNKPNPSKNSTYECGMPPVGTARDRFSVRFYVVAMLFTTSSRACSQHNRASVASAYNDKRSSLSSL